MESQPQNPEFRINPENFHPCISWIFLFNQRVKLDEVLFHKKAYEFVICVDDKIKLTSVYL